MRRKSLIERVATYSVVVFALLVTVTGCKRQVTVTTINPVTMPADVTVKEWHLIGPFHFSPESISPSNPAIASAGLNHDFLAELGYPEARLGEAALQSLTRRQDLYHTYRQSDTILSFDKLYPKMEYAVIYAVAEVTSTADADVGIAAGSDDGVKVWLNGKLLIATPNTIVRMAMRCDNIAVGHLHSGKNYILAKVDQKTEAWALVLDLLTLHEAHRISSMKQQREDYLLANRLLRPGEAAQVLLPLITGGNPLRFQVQNSLGQKVYSYQIPSRSSGEIRLPRLAEGVYDCTLEVGSESLHDAFYVGDLGALYQGLLRSRRKLAASAMGTAYLSLDAMIQRYEQLTKPEHYRPEDSNWQRKMLMVLRDGVVAKRNPTGLQWLQAPGWHFREFVSSIDGQPQNYLFYLPHSPARPLPIVFAMPGTLDPPRPFLESALITDNDFLAAYGQAADQAGVGLALLSGRGNVSDAPIGDTDVFEVMKDIRRDYGIDENRLYLYGNCEGARRALLLAEHHPGVFAAVGTYRTLASPYPGDELGHKWWSDHNNSEVLAGNLANTPVLLAFGDEDPDYPVPAARKFFEGMKRAGCPAQWLLFEHAGHGIYTVDPMTIVLPFLAKQRRSAIPREVQVTATRLKYAETPWAQVTGFVDPLEPVKLNARFDPGHVTIKTENVSGLEVWPDRIGVAAGTPIQIDWNGAHSTAVFQHAPIGLGSAQSSQAGLKNSIIEGPIADALAGPFEVVTGTGGSSAQQASARAATDTFARDWQAKFFVGCRRKLDREVTSDDLAAYNLVLIGKPENSGRLAHILEHLPITVQPAGVSIVGGWHAGEGIGFAAVFPNPLNRERYLVVIDSNAEAWKLPDYNFALTGFSDYAVWDSNGFILDSGVFDAQWRRVASFM